MMAGMMVEADEKGNGGCPLRRVQLWHTIPLCLLAIVNLLLVIVALLGVAREVEDAYGRILGNT